MSDSRKILLKPVHISEILDDVVKKIRPERYDTLSRLCRIWSEAVGIINAKYTSPKAIKGNELIVIVSNSPLLQQLNFMKNDMIEKINQTLGENLINEIIFKIGNVRNNELY